MNFKIKADFSPTGDQPEAIEKLVEGIKKGYKFQTLLGVTGSGKTFTMANIINQIHRPVLVISHNKTLAAQLYAEFKTFFPENSVNYFVSYYDYYQPEAYVPEKDLYIEKDASINEEIDRMRLATTGNLITRNDCIIVSSVSCLYGLGSPGEFKNFILDLRETARFMLEEVIQKLVRMQYQRNDLELARGRFTVKGDFIEVFPVEEDYLIRIEFFDDQIDRITLVDPINKKVIKKVDRVVVFPAKHFVTAEDRILQALNSIEEELRQRLDELASMGKLIEAQRLEKRTRYDMEMLSLMGYCSGIENYSRHLDGRQKGERPNCLLDYYPSDYIVFIDESHVSIPQLRGMYAGDRTRKEILVEFGFRLPSALDNRPLKFDEFIKIVPQVIFVSATPGPYEIEVTSQIVEQLIRPTGLVDPQVEVFSTEGQIDLLIAEINKVIERKERVLVTTLTKRFAEQLCDFLLTRDIKTRYLHSEIETIERAKLITALRRGDFDVLVGINLLREGLDLPEVSLVAILDADKEGFLRSERSILQTIGRAARNINGKVIMFGDNITDSMKRAISETDRRREKQIRYNDKHNIQPRSITKPVENLLEVEEEVISVPLEKLDVEKVGSLEEAIQYLETKMNESAKNWRFEEAAMLRDRIFHLKGKKTK
ncbi:MAG: excinuclease ABC subunit UvrB [Candidatus Hydrogenedentota bacterium]